jgi:hypothetical protein
MIVIMANPSSVAAQRGDNQGAELVRRRRYAIVEAPSILGLKPTGVEKLPEALLRYGLAERIRARRGARVDPPAYDFERDAETLTLSSRHRGLDAAAGGRGRRRH